MYPFLFFIFCNSLEIIRKGAERRIFRAAPLLLSFTLLYHPIGLRFFNDRSRMGALCVSAPDEI